MDNFTVSPGDFHRHGVTGTNPRVPGTAVVRPRAGRGRLGSWQIPTLILDARLIKFTEQLNF